MGADAEIFVFDHLAYQEILPAFHQFLLAGQMPEWLHPLVTYCNIKTEEWPSVDLMRNCAYLEADFSWSSPHDDRNLFESDWGQRSCKSEECPEIGRCPFHQSDASGLVESFNWIFKMAVSIKCLGASQFIGRSRYVTDYWPMLSDWGVRLDDPLWKLLTLLGKRGFVVGYQWLSSNDGINGWLDFQETYELAELLYNLPLPVYPASFEAMKEFLKPHPLLYEKFGFMVYEHPDFSFEALSLSFIRTVAEIAVAEGKGILWGNNVSPAEFYLERYFPQTDLI
ncbi:MAG TPA: hypothetical protein VIM99_04860 [Blastocatellia bacterium]